MATAHLIYGYLGAGKTTFARALEREVGGIRFSADEWYLRLYANSKATPHLEAAWWDRVLSMLDEIWPKVLEHRIDVVLDFGFWSRQLRDNARRLALLVGGNAKLYRITCDENVARARCLARNSHPSGVFIIDAPAFEVLRAKFEPLGPDEPCELIETTSDGIA
jgi:predicted kinase